MSTPRLRLGQLLVDANLLTQRALEDVLVTQRADGRRLGTLLVERGLINEIQLTQVLSHQLSVPWVSLLHIEFSRQLLNLVPREVAEQFCVVPIYVRHVRKEGDTLYVAMDDPTNEDGLRECALHAGLPVRSMIAPPADIRNAIRVYYLGQRALPATALAAPLPAGDPASPAVPGASGAGSATPAAAASAGRNDAAPAPPAEVAEPEAPSTVPDPVPGKTPVTVATEPQAAPGLGVERRPEVADIAIPPTPRAPAEPAAPRGREELPVESIPSPRGRAPRMVALTLLDGTTISLPAMRKRGPAPPEAPRRPAAAAGEPKRSEPPEDDAGLTARDLVAALRAVASGADASEVLGTNVHWEAMFGALLSLLLRKHLIADWEFVEELKRIQATAPPPADRT